eukprot:GILJ01007908.1.p1 GENE.GILJ01007908.1~~GILJ01007908.1.p1  ORF type:complete len:265 (+),score=33.03 GILJ01007908.1:587-1381(+)
METHKRHWPLKDVTRLVMRMRAPNDNSLETPGQWEHLRGEARKLEHELESKIQQYAKLSTTLGKLQADSNSKNRQDEDPEMGEGAPLISQNEQLAASLGTDIDHNLATLGNVTESMSRCVTSAATSALVQRYQDILQDYTREFSRIRSNINSYMKREELLRGARGRSSGLSSRTKELLRERAALDNSLSVADSVIDTARATRDNLTLQRQAFNNITDRLLQLGEALPGVNTLLGKIDKKKRKDAMIVGSVIAICTFATVIYMFG